MRGRSIFFTRILVLFLTVSVALPVHSGACPELCRRTLREEQDEPGSPTLQALTVALSNPPLPAQHAVPAAGAEEMDEEINRLRLGSEGYPKLQGLRQAIERQMGVDPWAAKAGEKLFKPLRLFEAPRYWFKENGLTVWGNAAYYNGVFNETVVMEWEPGSWDEERVVQTLTIVKAGELPREELERRHSRGRNVSTVQIADLDVATDLPGVPNTIRDVSASQDGSGRLSVALSFARGEPYLPAVLGLIAGLSVGKIIPAAGAEEETREDFTKEEIQKVRPDLTAALEPHFKELNRDGWSIPAIKRQIKGKVEKRKLESTAQVIHEAAQTARQKWLAHQEQIRRDQAIKKEQEMQAQLSPEEKTAQWVQREILPALRRLAESGLVDFSLLRNAGSSDRFSGSPQAWEILVRQMEEFVRQTAQKKSLMETQIRLIQWVNDHWLVEHHLLLFCAGDILVREATPLSYVNSLEIGQFVEPPRVYELSGRAIPAYFVRILYPTGKRTIMRAGWFPEGMIVMFPEHFKEAADRPRKNLEMLPTLSGKLFSQYGISTSYRQPLIAFYETLVRRFKDPALLQKDLVEGALFEELRHGVDRFLVMGEELEPEDRVVITTQDLFFRFAEGQLSANGNLRKDFGKQKNRGKDHAIGYARLVTELSGQLANAAFISDPNLMLDSWIMRFVELAWEGPGEEYPEHAYSAIAATLLLADQVKQTGEVSWPFEISLEEGVFAKDPNIEQIYSMVLALGELPPKRLRLAIKAVYNREFIHSIDELPFPEIGPDGTLNPRMTATSATPAGAEEMEVKSAVELAGRPEADAKELAAQAAAMGASDVLLIPQELLKEETLPPQVKIHLYAHKEVMAGAYTVLPVSIRDVESLQIHELPEDPEQARRLIGEIPEDQMAVVALDARFKERVEQFFPDPKDHPLTFLMTPGKWEDTLNYQREIAALLAGPVGQRRNLILFLSAGSVVRRELVIGGKKYGAAIFA